MKSLLVLLACVCLLQVTGQSIVTVSLVIDKEPRTFEGGVFFTLKKPEGVAFKDGQFMLCRGAFKKNESDTVQKGTGKVSRISTDGIECTMATKNMKATPAKGDVCTFLIRVEEERKDVFYPLARNAISFTSVTDSVIFSAFNSLGTWNEDRSQLMLKALVDDIHYTGAEMLKQNDGQQQTIKGGDFDGKPLFTAMQAIVISDLQNFLEYVWARPTKYAGNTWKISETFATWMISETPKRLVDIEN